MILGGKEWWVVGINKVVFVIKTLLLFCSIRSPFLEVVLTKDRVSSSTDLVSNKSRHHSASKFGSSAPNLTQAVGHKSWTWTGCLSAVGKHLYVLAAHFNFTSFFLFCNYYYLLFLWFIWFHVLGVIFLLFWSFFGGSYFTMLTSFEHE